MGSKKPNLVLFEFPRTISHFELLLTRITENSSFVEIPPENACIIGFQVEKLIMNFSQNQTISNIVKIVNFSQWQL